MKTCSKCNTLKDLSKFAVAKGKQFNRASVCKICTKEYNKNYYISNKEKIKKASKSYRSNNREKAIEYSRIYYLENKESMLHSQKDYYRQNKQKINGIMWEYAKNRLNNDVNFKLGVRLRTRLYTAIKRNKKSGSHIKDLGCTLDQLKQHLESKFQPGMTWDNWGRNGWHIDHIRPLASFDLTDREQFLQAVHYTNLQPLWAKDNIRKKDK